MKIVCHLQLLVFFSIWYVHAIDLKGKKDIKYLNIEKLFDKKYFSRIKLTVLMC